MSNAAFALLPDFIRCAVIMRLPVGIVRVLVGVEVLIRVFSIEFPSFADRPIRSFPRISKNNLRTVSMQDSFALNRNILRHAKRHWKSFSSSDHGERNTSIPTGRVQQNFSRP